MSLNIKNPVVERLADEVAPLTGESKIEAIRKALEERRARVNFQLRVADLFGLPSNLEKKERT